MNTAYRNACEPSSSKHRDQPGKHGQKDKEGAAQALEISRTDTIRREQALQQRQAIWSRCASMNVADRHPNIRQPTHQAHFCRTSSEHATTRLHRTGPLVHCAANGIRKHLNVNLHSKLTQRDHFSYLVYERRGSHDSGSRRAGRERYCKLYIDARRHCYAVGDFDTRALFYEVIADEEGHIDFLETHLALFYTLSAESYGMLNVKPADQAQ